jgi:putative addiction module component (TIGR02574 family)
MTALSELKSLPVVQRLRLVEDLWNSIVEDQHSLPDPPGVIAEVRARAAKFRADPSSGVTWEEAKRRIRSERV